MVSTDFVAAVEQRLSALLQARQAVAATPDSTMLIERLQEVILRAGKRSRPRLLALTYEAYGGTDTTKLIDIGVALELQHQSLLLHDDIMDNDTVRYDGLNVLGMYRQEFPSEKTTVADAMALMGGNLLATFAVQAILESKTLKNDEKLAVLTVLQDTNVAVHVGQQLDIVNVMALQPQLAVEKLLQIDYLKTAVYSLQQPLLLAAKLQKLPKNEQKHLQEFARATGILYQLVDDYSDYFTNQSSFESHPKFRDFRQGKITYPLLIALQQASPQSQAFLRKQAGNKDLSNEDMMAVVGMLETAGGKTAAEKQIAEYHAAAQAALNATTISDTGRKAFAKLLKTFQI